MKLWARGDAKRKFINYYVTSLHRIRATHEIIKVWDGADLRCMTWHVNRVPCLREMINLSDYFWTVCWLFSDYFRHILRLFSNYFRTIFGLFSNFFPTVGQRLTKTCFYLSTWPNVFPPKHNHCQKREFPPPPGKVCVYSADRKTKWESKLRNYSVKLKFSTARRGLCGGSKKVEGR